MTIMVARESTEWTLTEASRLLREPQHRLIYLCEKDVVRPDVQDAKGRGSSRRFSARNLLEFAVALRLRDIEIPAYVVAAVIHVLREFEQMVRKQIPGFELPQSLRNPKAPDLRAIIGDGSKLYFSLGSGKATPKLYGGVDLREFSNLKRGGLRLQGQLSRLKTASHGSSSLFGQPEGSRHSRVEVSITRIARDLNFGE